MNEKEALLIIEDMISKTREGIRDNGFYYMLWGWLVFIAALTDYTLLMIVRSDSHSVVWGILMPLGGLVSVIASIRESKRTPRVRTYLDNVLKYVTVAYTIAILIVCFIMPSTTQNWRAFFPTLMVIYGMGIFIYGGALKFKPLIYGGIVNWVCAIPGFYLQYNNQLLLLALAVLLGFIIPGHLLKSRFNKEHVQGS